jgi:hypothetical protein
MKQIQKVYVLHDTFYPTFAEVPESDGKDTVRVMYAIVDVLITEPISSERIYHYSTYDEARDVLSDG